MSGRADYEERKQIKIERYKELSENASKKSKEYSKQHEKISSAIPMGQPILTDHYSAKRHIKDIERMNKSIEKSIQEDEKANYYADKVETMQNNNIISSDDPKAIEKLEQKLKSLEEYKTRVKSRDHQAYELTNLNAEIRRIKERIKNLKELDELQFDDIEFKGGKVIHNKEINRIQFIFDTIPSEEIRTILKTHGFKWSRYEKAWQRLFNKNGIRAVKYVVREILQDEFNNIKKEIDNYTEENLLKAYETLTGLKQENMSIEEIRQYLKDYWKEQIYKDEKMVVQ